MLPPKKWRLLLFVLAVARLSSVPAAETRDVSNGKKDGWYIRLEGPSPGPLNAPSWYCGDENGYFEVSGRQPGQYLVGVGLLAPFDSAEWQSRVYDPGVLTRERAKVIEFDVGEWRIDIDFKLLSSPAY